jgi:hypothetical protein
MLLNSCEAEFKPATFKTTSIDNGFEADITATFDEATGNNDLSENINASITLAIIGTLSASDVKTDLNAVLKDFNSEFVDFKKDLGTKY